MMLLADATDEEGERLTCLLWIYARHVRYGFMTYA